MQSDNLLVLETLGQEVRDGNWKRESVIAVIHELGNEFQVPCLAADLSRCLEGIAEGIARWESSTRCNCNPPVCETYIERIARILRDYRHEMAKEYVEYLFNNNLASALFPTGEILNPVVEAMVEEGTAAGWRPSHDSEEYVAYYWKCDHEDEPEEEEEGELEGEGEWEGEGMIVDDSDVEMG